MASPEIRTSAFRLRPLRCSDANDWFAYLSMPETLLHTSWSVRSVEDLHAALEQYASDVPDSSIRFAIEPADGGPLIGTIGFHGISGAHRTAEVAFDIHPRHWRQGIASVCCDAVVEWGFSHLGLVRVQAAALESNLGSIRVLEKCGFVREGKARNFRLVRDEPRDFWLYSRIP